MEPDDAAGAALLGIAAQPLASLKRISIDTPRAELIDAFNRMVDQLGAISSGGRTLDYLPVMSNSTNTIGNGSLRGRYIKFGNMVWFEIVMTWGSTTALAASPDYPYFTLPVPALDDGLDRSSLGNGAWFPMAGSYRLAYDPTTDVTTTNSFGVMKVDKDRIFISWDNTTPTPATYQTAGDIWRFGGFYPTE